MSSNYLRILSIDGGGIKGVLPGQILVSLEQKLQAKSGNPNARIADYFDLFAGTSTGGILTCIYLCPDANGKPKYTAQQAVDLYLKKGESIFHTSLKDKIKSLGGVADEKYPSKPIEENLKEYFGTTMLSDLIKPCIITSYNITERYSHFFRSHRAKLKTSDNFPLWQVARSTSAAPTYFEPSLAVSQAGVSYPLVDGGVFANNPAMCAYAEARSHFESKDPNVKSRNKNVTLPEMFMVSIGTGSKEKPYKYDDAKDWGLIKWVQPVLDIMMGGVSETVDYQLAQMFDAVSNHHYYRILPEIIRATTDMDDASEKNLQNLKEDGIESAIKNDKQLEAIADFLTQGNSLSA